MEATENKQTRSCPGDCRRCNIYQHAYCGAQMCLKSFPLLETIMQTLEGLKAEVAELKAEKELALPNVHSKSGGAENRPLETINNE